MPAAGLTLALIARIPAEGVEAFRAYEDAVLPLLRDHGGTLQRRLCSAPGTTEIHLVLFPSREHFAGFRADPRRASYAALLEASGATTELIEMDDMPVA